MLGRKPQHIGWILNVNKYHPYCHVKRVASYLIHRWAKRQNAHRHNRQGGIILGEVIPFYLQNPPPLYGWKAGGHALYILAPGPRREEALRILERANRRETLLGPKAMAKVERARWARILPLGPPPAHAPAEDGNRCLAPR